MDIKLWFRNNVKPYLTLIKSWINTAKSQATAAAVTQANAYTDTGVASAKAYTDTVKSDLLTQVGSVAGAYKGSYATVASFPTSNTGDWAILSTDVVGTGTVATPQYESGIYVKSATGWDFVSDIQSFQEIRTEILASDAEVSIGNSTSKVMTVLQTVNKINATITALNLSTTYAAKAGLNTQTFEVANGQAGTKQAVNAGQFGTAINASEAQADWDAS